MKKICLLLAAVLLLVTAPAYAADWHQTSADDSQTCYVDTDSIRYVKDRSGSINRNIVSFYLKTTYAKSLILKDQPGGDMVSLCSINIEKRTQAVYTYTYADRFGSLAGSDTSGGIPAAAEKDPAVKAVCDYVGGYCQTNDARVTANTDKAPAAEQPAESQAEAAPDPEPEETPTPPAVSNREPAIGPGAMI